LIIELDGGQHTPGQDASRTRAIEVAGYTIVRLCNHDVLQNTEGVVEEIRAALRNAHQ
jgi:very-short-patch-repair endonuclease